MKKTTTETSTKDTIIMLFWTLVIFFVGLWIFLQIAGPLLKWLGWA
jgi:hypothetical protein